MTRLPDVVSNLQDTMGYQPSASAPVARRMATDLELLADLTIRRKDVLQRLTEEVLGHLLIA